MLSELASHNGDLKRLLEKGYALGFDSNYLLVRDIPYLNEGRELKTGTIVTELVFVDNNTVIQKDHTVLFAGSAPCNLDGTPIPNLGGGAATAKLSDACTDVAVERSFSNKPREAGRFADFFDKIEGYVDQISGPAVHLHGATPYTFRVVDREERASIFKVRDTLTSLAGIGDLATRFANDDVAVIGLGGTGSYLLDLLVKTPIPRIRAFDSDLFYVHNSFRSPGAISAEEFGKAKADVYRSRHENYRHGVAFYPQLIDESSADALLGVTFAFVCVDKGSSRKGIFDVLLSMRIPFIDVGMGLNRDGGDPLTGMVRVTYYPQQDGDGVRRMQLADETDDPNDAYHTNIQTGELNSLNACLAVIKFKQLRGFYQDDGAPFHFLFDIGDLKIVGQEALG